MDTCDNCQRNMPRGIGAVINDITVYCPDCVRAYLVGYEAGKADAEHD